MRRRERAAGGPCGGSTPPVDELRALARLYGRIREAFAWSNQTIDALTIEEAEEIVEHWNEEPPVGALVRMYFGVQPASDDVPEPPLLVGPRDVTQAEWDRIVQQQKAEAARYGGPRNPFT